MHKLNWDKIDVGDISLYVKLVKKTLYTHVKIIRHFLNEIYFVYYLNKVVLMMNKIFL
jgi:hypothetical protein